MFSFTGTYFSRFLSLMSGEKYIHVSITFNENLKEVYSFGRKHPRWAFPNGFVIEDMKNVTDVFSNAVFKMYKLSLTKSEHESLLKELKKYQDNKNKYRYNLKGLMHIKLNRVYHRKRHFVCSQFVAKILSDAKIYNFNKDYSLIRPRDIARIPNLTLVYEGKMLDYLKVKQNAKTA